MNLITAKDLSVSFEGHEIFKKLNFSVAEGDYFCILGENGSGKTTLMRCILGLGVRYSGRIECHGFARREIGWLPQRSEAERDFPASVAEVALSGFSGKSFFGLRCKSALRNKARRNMELLELTGLENRAFSELSGGQQQRVLLCRALCAADRVLLLDEPVTGLDAVSREELYASIRRLNRSGMTVLMITHDVARAVAEADRILHIGDGGSFFGTPQEYQNTAYFERIKGAQP